MTARTLRARRFRDKDAVRRAVWDALAAAGAARFPFPPHGRIPNFAGAAEAAARTRGRSEAEARCGERRRPPSPRAQPTRTTLVWGVPGRMGAGEAAARVLEHPLLRGARRVKCNPDAPQLPVRRALLARGVTLYLPTPRLRGGFLRLDPARIPSRERPRAVTLAGARRWGEPVAVEALPAMDAVVTGSVAVTPTGKRCGKGHGYGDLEYAVLRELGHPPVPVLTTVHPLQIVGDFPADAHDLPVRVISTPETLIEVADPPPPPAGIDWKRLDEAALAAMPVLAELRAMCRPSAGSRRSSRRR